MKHNIFVYLLCITCNTLFGAASSNEFTGAQLKQQASIKSLQTLCAKEIALQSNAPELIKQLPQNIHLRHDEKCTGPLNIYAHAGLLARNYCIRTLQGHIDSAYSVAFSPDGKTLASGSRDSNVKLWNASTGGCIQTLQGHTDWVRSIAFNPNGETLASGSHDKTVKLWNTQSGKYLYTLQGHTDCVYSVAFNPDGITLASGSRDKTIKLWNASTGRCIRTLQGHTDFVVSVAFSPDGKTLASADGTTIKLWSLLTGACTQTLKGHANFVLSVAFSPNGITLASGSMDCTVKLWDSLTGDCIRTLQDHTNSVNSIAFNPDFVPDFVRSIAFSPDGETLASGSNDRTIKLWDASTQRLQGHTHFVLSVAFSPDGETLASGSDDNTIKLWRINFKRNLAKLAVHEGIQDFILQAAQDWHNNQPHQVSAEDPAYKAFINELPECDNKVFFIVDTSTQLSTNSCPSSIMKIIMKIKRRKYF